MKEYDRDAHIEDCEVRILDDDDLMLIAIDYVGWNMMWSVLNDAKRDMMREVLTAAKRDDAVATLALVQDMRTNAAEQYAPVLAAEERRQWDLEARADAAEERQYREYMKGAVVI